MLDQKAKEIVDNEYSYCENCGLLTHDDEMHNAYPHNGFESWGEALYSECNYCHQVELDRFNNEYRVVRRTVWARGA